MIQDADLEKLKNAFAASVAGTEENRGVPESDLKGVCIPKTDTIDYLLDRIKELHIRRPYLKDSFYNSRLEEYFQRIREVK